MVNLEMLCHDVVELAREVGIFIKIEEKNVQQKDIEEKSLNSLVSYVDKQAEKQIVDNLSLFLPEAGFIAEEVDEAGLTEFVDYNPEGQPDALHYANMNALLTKALQEAIARIEILESK